MRPEEAIRLRSVRNATIVLDYLIGKLNDPRLRETAERVRLATVSIEDVLLLGGVFRNPPEKCVGARPRVVYPVSDEEMCWLRFVRDDLKSQRRILATEKRPGIAEVDEVIRCSAATLDEIITIIRARRKMPVVTPVPPPVPTDEMLAKALFGIAPAPAPTGIGNKRGAGKLAK
jgi:hypothetical protein